MHPHTASIVDVIIYAVPVKMQQQEMQSMLGRKSGSLVLQVTQHALLVLVLLPILNHNVVRKLHVHIAILVSAEGIDL